MSRDRRDHSTAAGINRFGIFVPYRNLSETLRDAELRHIDFLMAPRNAENDEMAYHGSRTLRSKARGYVRVPGWGARRVDSCHVLKVSVRRLLGAYLSMSESPHRGCITITRRASSKLLCPCRKRHAYPFQHPNSNGTATGAIHYVALLLYFQPARTLSRYDSNFGTQPLGTT